MKKLILPRKLEKRVSEVPQTGMGWSVVRVVLKNGKIFKNVLIENDSEIFKVYGYEKVPFQVSDIKDIIVTHSKDYPKNFKGFVQNATEGKVYQVDSASS